MTNHILIQNKNSWNVVLHHFNGKDALSTVRLRKQKTIFNPKKQ
ncbi:hypothetical protein ACQKCU_18385 [Heyndrickxia sporothermodurans]